ncbi:hypothetical protein PoB_002262600 [Plakobranchus ocellatus]|uniref:Uncharacterized protein n=1 Tax=Plakobranchus ocellatus TaxID=259542 RepID=A0AAV3ZJI4_9GAST|nr:hypothetical protein PoB_002262600 [Plakobranchus ocellatus]
MVFGYCLSSPPLPTVAITFLSLEPYVLKSTVMQFAVLALTCVISFTLVKISNIWILFHMHKTKRSVYMCTMHTYRKEKWQSIMSGVGGTVVTESVLRSAGPFYRGFEPSHRRHGLTEGLKA